MAVADRYRIVSDGHICRTKVFDDAGREVGVSGFSIGGSFDDGDEVINAVIHRPHVACDISTDRVTIDDIPVDPDRIRADAVPVPIGATGVEMDLGRCRCEVCCGEATHIVRELFQYSRDGFLFHATTAIRFRCPAHLENGRIVYALRTPEERATSRSVMMEVGDAGS
jgi:hypothetical protein